MDASIFVRFQPIPLGQYVEGGYLAAQMGFKPAPGVMPHLLAAPHRSHHGKGSFHDHPHVPLSPSADFHVGWVALGPVKPSVGQDDHRIVVAGQQGLKPLVVDVGGGAIPGDDLAQLVDDDGEFAAHNPAMIGLALLAHLVEVPSRTHRMAQFDAVTVGHAQDGGLGQEAAGPAGLGFQAAEEAGALGEFGEEVAIVALEPVLTAWRMPMVSSSLRERTA